MAAEAEHRDGGRVSLLRRTEMPRKLRDRKCRSCGDTYSPWSGTQKACSPRCALALAQKQRERKAAKAAKEMRRRNRAAKERIKPRGTWLSEAQAEFNKWVRLRDYGEPCISCGRHHQGQHHASHYRSVGACPELRFEPLNVHKSCAPCNSHLSGNLIEYRLRLIDKIGQDKVDWLEGPHEPKKYTGEQIKAIRADYRRRAREIRRAIDGR